MIDRIRAALHALFARNPTITVEVVNGSWMCEWRGMDRDGAAIVLGAVHDVIVRTAFEQAPCSATVH